MVVSSAVGAPAVQRRRRNRGAPPEGWQAAPRLGSWGAGEQAGRPAGGGAVALIRALGPCHPAMDGGWPAVPRGSSGLFFFFLSYSSAFKWVKVHLPCVCGNSPSLCLNLAAVPIPRPPPASKLVTGGICKKERKAWNLPRRLLWRL